MLSYLHVRGLALLDDVALELGRGMNVLTGETGAGKSILVDALALLRGARGRAELVRQGADAARVAAQFDLDPPALARIAPVLSELGQDPSEAALVLERVVGRSGRGRSVVQSVLTTQGVLERVGEQLIDICSQHEHHSLTHVARHLDLLDTYANLDSEVVAYTEVYHAWQDAKHTESELRQRAADAETRAEFLRYQIDELERADPQPGEFEALRARIALLRDGQRWAAFARQAHDTLYEADDAIASRLASLLDEARRGAESSRLLAEIHEQLGAAQVACEEAAAAASRFASELTFEPGELELAEERLHELETLRRKHGPLEAVPERLEAMRSELADVENVDAHLAALGERVRELHSQATALAAALHERRVAAASGWVTAVETELAALHIPRARVEAHIEPLPDAQLGPRGSDRVEFMFSANPGEPLAPLNRVASGGELSRVLLAVKSVLATGDHVTTYVFDEVDAGVGGAVAEAIGRRLRAASQQRQVLCITHLPQIAAFADTHFRVEKTTQDGRTTTRVTRLSADERVEEIARMLGGARITGTARDHASELMAEAQRPVRKPAQNRSKARTGTR